MTTYIARLLNHMVTEKYTYIEILERKLKFTSKRNSYQEINWQIAEEYGKVKQLREHIKQTQLYEGELL